MTGGPHVGVTVVLSNSIDNGPMHNSTDRLLCRSELPEPTSVEHAGRHRLVHAIEWGVS